jgi:hypothetical protein
MKMKEKVQEFIDDYKSSLIVGSFVILTLMLLLLTAYHIVVFSSIAIAIGLLGYLLWRK